MSRERVSEMTVMDGFSLNGKNAVITGAGRGIGRALALALSQAGASVAVVGRDQAGIQATSDLIKAQGGRSIAVFADITTSEGIDTCVTETLAGLGSLDILVNNAGFCVHKPSFDVTREDYHAVMDVNLEAVFFLSQAAGKVMAEQGGGNIINIGSMSAMIVNRPQWQPAYNASKAAVHHLTKSFAAEWAPLNIRVNAIAPGYIKTEMAEVDKPEFKQHWIDDAAQKRYATPEELGSTLIYLAGDGASYVTGSVVVVDGGYTLY